MDTRNIILHGVLYVLFAAGLSLVIGVMRLVNIAHGDLIVLAADVALVVVVQATGARGTLAASNAEQVTKFRRIIEGPGCEVANPAEAREMLALKGADCVAFQAGMRQPGARRLSQKPLSLRPRSNSRGSGAALQSGHLEGGIMQLTDQRSIAARPETVWAAILNPEVLRACVPGCESLTGSPEDGFTAVVVQKVGPVSARFTGMVKLSDITPGKAVTISGEGKGGPAGYAKGGAKVTLAPQGQGTLLTYTVDASVGGKIAQLGSRIIDGFAKKMADQFFERFQRTVEGPASTAADPNDTGTAKSWLSRLIHWVGGIFGQDQKGGAK